LNKGTPADDSIADSLQDIGLHELITAIDSDTASGFAPIDKLDAHIHNVPHVAISVFILQDDHLLIQRRAKSKYHSGGLWANSVCSHPRWQESATDCAHRRLQEELGWQTTLTEFTQLSYTARVGKLYENEFVHCFVGNFPIGTDLARFNPLEVMEVQWVRLNNLEPQIRRNPEKYSEWFKIYIDRHFDLIEAQIK